VIYSLVETWDSWVTGSVTFVVSGILKLNGLLLVIVTNNFLASYSDEARKIPFKELLNDATVGLRNAARNYKGS
jgi:hypothetical protein